MEERHMKGIIFKMSKYMTATNNDVIAPGGIKKVRRAIEKSKVKKASRKHIYIYLSS